MFEFVLFDLAVVHFVFAAFAAVVCASENGLAADYASGEVASAGAADGVVLADRFFAVSAWALYAFARCLLGRVFGEDGDGDVGVAFALICRTHALQLYESAGALLVALNV